MGLYKGFNGVINDDQDRSSFIVRIRTREGRILRFHIGQPMSSLAENHELRGRKLWISFFNITFLYIFHAYSMEFRFFFIPLLPNY